MTIAASDIKFRKSKFITDTDTNGGLKSAVEVISGVRHNLFPRVTKNERTLGVTRHRKEFWANENSGNEVAYGMMAYLEAPSNAGDRFYLGKGTQDDTQGDLTAETIAWTGAGQLNAALAGGETQLQLAMESNDFEFFNGGYLHLSNKYMSGQAIDTDVNVGDSIQWVVGTGQWERINPDTSITYPKGIYMGSNLVMTEQVGSAEEWLLLADNEILDEVIGAGDGSTVSVVLTDLADASIAAYGLCTQPGKKLVVKAVIGGADKFAYFKTDGTLDLATSDALGGEINLATGVWVTDINWGTAPDNSTNITATYYVNCFKYTANVATIDLSNPVASAYADTSISFGGGCVEGGDVTPSKDNEINNGSGTADWTNNPLLLDNRGTVEDEWTITFVTQTTYTISGANSGAIAGTHNVGSLVAPSNPDNNQPYFQIPANYFAGAWANGETYKFDTHAAAVPLWLKEVVPINTPQEPYNVMVLGWYAE